MVTVPAVMLLWERELIDLNTPAAQYLPAFAQNRKGHVTIRQLLTHTAGLREFYPFYDMGLTQKEQVRQFILADKCWYPPGTTKYSDLSMIVLGWIVEAITGQKLDAFVQKELHAPLGMHDTHFRPAGDTDFDIRVIPTEVDQGFRKRLLWGEVHDPTAYLLGGVAGHAGLFSTADDISRFARMMLAGGVDPASGRRFFEESTMRLFTRQQLEIELSPRPFALGFDATTRRALDNYTSGGRFLGRRSFGHTGFTGTSLWMDPERNVFVALLTNAVHPSAESAAGAKIRDVRPAIADAAVLTLEALPFPRERLLWHDLSLPERGVDSEAQLDPPPAGLSVSVPTGGDLVGQPQGLPRGGAVNAELNPLTVGAFASIGSGLGTVSQCFGARDSDDLHDPAHPSCSDQSLLRGDPPNEKQSPHWSHDTSQAASFSEAGCGTRLERVGLQGDIEARQVLTGNDKQPKSEAVLSPRPCKGQGGRRKGVRSRLRTVSTVATRVASVAAIGMAIRTIC